ncbi:MAG: hypothetical protein Q9169_004151 [Polycauliona sp. 2 TL-2023]
MHVDACLREQVRLSKLSPASRLIREPESYFAALDAYNCLISIPLNETVASDFLQYYRDTLEFQSTLTYLKNPPSSYQQPATDLLAGLDQIRRQLDTGIFGNQYEFEVAVLDLVYSAHDYHTQLYGGATNVFSFGSPFEIVSVSTDGIKPPQVYIADDLFESLFSDYTASPIATVNGQPALEYYSDFAARNSLGYLDPHADWNNLMYSPAGEIQGLVSDYTGQTPFYPGEVFSIVLENGTAIGDWTWLAVLNNLQDAGTVSSISEFYSTFVAYDASEDVDGVLKKKKRAPESTTTATAAPTAAPSLSPNSWSDSAYPADPFVSQKNLGSGGVLSGYLIEDSTAVLSIPSFNILEDDIEDFSATVARFLKESKSRGARRILIDLQQNYGGVRLLAGNTFQQFFPSVDPYAGSRGRANNIADTLGNTYTKYYNSHRTGFNQSFSDYFAQSLWVAPNFLNAVTNRAFTTWAEYFGPHGDRLDQFTTQQRDNLSSTVFTENNLGEAIVYGFGNHESSPYDAKDIIILTDALCSSTCAIFVEMMHHEASVKTVVVGGQPQLLGPMQAVAGSRGSRDYESDDLDIDVWGAASLNASVSAQLPDRDIDFYLDTATVNYQDQIRRGENFPLQFSYEAANCRIYHTVDTIFNMSALWSHAARAIWTDPSLCVKHSTDHPSSNSKETDTIGPSPADKASWTIPSSPPSISSTIHNNNISIPLSDLAYDQEPETAISGREGADCPPNNPGYCKELACVQAPWCSPKGEFYPEQYQCVRLTKDSCSKGQVPGRGNCKLNRSGKCDYCKPKVPITSQTCGTSTTHVVPNDRISQPRVGGRPGGSRGGRRRR